MIYSLSVFPIVFTHPLFRFYTMIGYATKDTSARVTAIITTFHFQVFLIVICPPSKKNGAKVELDGTSDAKLAIKQIITVSAAVGKPAATNTGTARLKYSIMQTVFDIKFVSIIKNKLSSVIYANSDIEDVSGFSTLPALQKYRYLCC